jgi:hypothetical protein
MPPSKAPAEGGDSEVPVGAIVGGILGAGAVAGLGLFLYYRSWNRKRQERLAAGAPPPPADRRRAGSSIWSRPSRTGAADQNVLISPTDSLRSNKSLLSEGKSGLEEDSGDEMDDTKNLQDEFDQYKDQNLEQLRTDVEGNLSGFEGVMSAAVTNALMGDEALNVDMDELLWGCDPDPDGTQIEASALCEVDDWLKRNASAPLEKRRAFMQDILNKMVASVRYGVLGADDASRTIHECAALLGLQLAEELPMTTVIISGMRKTVESSHILRTMKEFGDIDVAAVASGQRGFGIVRFRRQKSVNQAMKRYRSGEIVVQDVAVQLRVLTPSGVVESRD